MLFVVPTSAQPARENSSQRSSDEAEQSTPNSVAVRQQDLEAKFVEMLSGATLEGTYTSTAPGSDPTKLSRERYTIGEVKKIAGNIWLIPARIEYGDHDVTLPITVPVKWAGDTPVIVVDNVGLPGFGTVSARVMFFADHYAGYWRHGEHGGHLFGTIGRGDDRDAQPIAPSDNPDDDQPSGSSEKSAGDSSGGQEPNE
jgi:hypothetical protein